MVFVHACLKILLYAKTSTVFVEYVAITKHLENYDTCPCCSQDLTVESLADAPRFFKNLLSEQRIRCDHHERGCQEIVQLGNLASHVAVCGKAPVLCENEECSSEINREDQFRHQNEECRFPEVKCRNCKEMTSMVQEIGTSLDRLSEHVQSLNKQSTEVKTDLTALGDKFENMENKFENMENKFGDIGLKKWKTGLKKWKTSCYGFKILVNMEQKVMKKKILIVIKHVQQSRAAVWKTQNNPMNMHMLWLVDMEKMESR